MKALPQAILSDLARAIAAVIGTPPPAPTCARCRAVLCGCADHIWKG